MARNSNRNGSRIIAEPITMTIPKLSFTRKKKSFVRKTQHAPHDWVLALLLFVLVNLVGIGLSAYAFVTVRNQDKQDINASPGTSTIKNIIDEELLQKTIKAYDDKEAQFNAFKETPPDAPNI